MITMYINGLNIVSGIVKCSNHICLVILTLLPWNSKKIFVHLSQHLARKTLNIISLSLLGLFCLKFFLPILLSESCSFCKCWFKWQLHLIPIHDFLPSLRRINCFLLYVLYSREHLPLCIIVIFLMGRDPIFLHVDT